MKHQVASARHGRPSHRSAGLEGLESRRLMAAEVAFDLSPTGLSPGQSIVLGNLAIFVGSSAAYGQELFQSDGRERTTKLLQDFRPGATGSAVGNLMRLGGGYAFTARPANGEGVFYAASASATPTRIGALQSFSSPEIGEFAAEGERLYHVQYRASQAGRAYLYVTTPTQTILRSIYADFGQGNVQARLTDLTGAGGRMFYIVTTTDTQLWSTSSSDATARVNTGFSTVHALHELDGKLYVDATRSGSRGLFSVDPSTLAVTRLASANRGEPVALIGSRLVFSTLVDGRRVLRAVDGANVITLDGMADDALVGADRKPGFVYYTNSAGELYKTDGTDAGTQLLDTLTLPAGTTARPVLYGEKIYLSFDGPAESEVFEYTESSDALVSVGTFRDPEFVEAPRLMVIGGNSLGDRQLFSIGTADAAPSQLDVNFRGPLSSNPSNLVGLGDRMIFTAPAVANDGTGRATLRLYSTDGYAAPTLLREIGLDDASTAYAHVVDDRVSAISDDTTALIRVQRTRLSDGQTRQELWRSDGTAEGTYRIAGPFKDIKFLDRNGRNSFFVTSSGATASDSYDTIHVTRGTTRTTRALQTFATAGPVDQAAVLKDKLYFVVGDGQGTLMSSTGSVEGTSTADLFTRATRPFRENVTGLVVSGETLYFVGGAAGDRRVISTNGTAGSATPRAQMPSGFRSESVTLHAVQAGLATVLAPVGGGPVRYFQFSLPGPTVAAANEYKFVDRGAFLNQGDVVVAEASAGGYAYFVARNRATNSYSPISFDGTVARRLERADNGGVRALQVTLLTKLGDQIYASTGNGRQLMRLQNGAARPVFSGEQQIDARSVARVNSRVLFSGVTPEAGREVMFGQESGRLVGNVVEDLDGDGTRDPNEPGAPGVTVYLDLNANGTREANEPSDVTSSTGRYAINDVTRNQGVLRVDDADYRTATTTGVPFSFPTSSGQTQFSQSARTVLVRRSASISGTVFNDLNESGRQDVGEAGRRGAVVFLDANGNGLLDTGERSDTTDEDGAYEFVVDGGKYRVVVQPSLDFYHTGPRAYDNVRVASGGSTVRRFGTLAI